MKMHGWICSWCGDYSKQVHQVSNTVHDQGESLAELTNEELSEDCKARLQAMMEANSAEADKQD